MKIGEAINNQNIELFKKYNITKMKQKIYKCVLCERDTCLNESQSIEGSFLVCIKCAYNEFGSWDATRKWQLEMEKHFE